MEAHKASQNCCMPVRMCISMINEAAHRCTRQTLAIRGNADVCCLAERTPQVKDS
ncbi:MAG: hypothetical protein P8M25_14475 [Paracoccaceae bacterium]|nr:hypothetical protein [Paracoccaceae bacterium]